jgi:hypothetical protein
MEERKEKEMDFISRLIRALLIRLVQGKWMFTSTALSMIAWSIWRPQLPHVALQNSVALVVAVLMLLLGQVALVHLDRRVFLEGGGTAQQSFFFCLFLLLAGTGLITAYASYELSIHAAVVLSLVIALLRSQALPPRQKKTRRRKRAPSQPTETPPHE